MFQFGFLVFALLSVTASSVRAETVPDIALRKDYENCMGGQTAAQAPERGRYCDCVVNEMRRWTAADYAAVNQQAAAPSAMTAPPEKLAALGKSCFDKVMH